MPNIQLTNYDTYYELDDFTHPWETGTDTVVIQHGIGRNVKFWHHWSPALAGDYRVIRRDLPGHGRSADPGPNHAWSFEALLEDLAEFLDALDLERVHYLGESTGGRIGIAFAARAPERLKSLTFCATPIRAVINNPDHTGIDSRPGDRDSEAWMKYMIESKGISGGSSAAQFAWVMEQGRNIPDHVLSGIISMAVDVDLMALLPELNVPTLVLAPTQSPLAPLPELIDMRQRIPNARIAVVEGPGHEIYVDSADDCIAAYKRFLPTVP
jgi:pimeloyl-ACP methyl ester carboxylesterase